MKLENINNRISDAELERRWMAVKTAMETAGLDVLVMQNTNDWLGGYVRWFTDIPANNGYPRTVAFYVDRPMTVIEMGEFKGNKKLGNLDEVHRGVDHILTTPSFFSIGYTNKYDPDLLIEDLKQNQAKSIGILTPGSLPYSLVNALNTELDGSVQVSDATDLIDAIKAIKSDAEISLIEKTAELQDKVFSAVSDFIRPGLRDIDIANFAQAEAHKLGSDQGIFLGTSAKIGKSSRFAPRQFQGRTIEKGEHFSLLIEVNGLGGMYLEIARTMVLGKASQKLLDSFEQMKQAQLHTLSNIRPGVLASEVAVKHNDWMKKNGLPIENRLYAHGQGYDMVERPLIRHDETMELAAGMCLAVHPGFDDQEVFSVICDNYLVTEDGVSNCLHKTEKKIFEL